MLLVLMALCVGFSIATLTEQQPNAADAARQMEQELGTTPWSEVLVVSSSSREDIDFADALKELALRGGVTSEAWQTSLITGTPQEARRAIQTHASSRLTIVQSPDTKPWKIFEGVAEKFPDKTLRVIAPRSVIGSNFLKSKNLINIVNQIVVIAILAVGMTLVILTGGIDLSVGSLIALSAVICTLSIRNWGGGEQASVGAMVACGMLALLICGLCGLFNGMLIVGFQMPPFIATLGMMLIASGIAFLLSNGQSIDAVPENFIWLGRGAWLGIPVAVIMMLILYAVMQFVMKRTVYGRTIYAIGGNAEAARLCGIRVSRVVATTYGLCGLLAGLGGLVMASRLRSGDAKYGTMYELYVIAAVVVGGTSLRGGYGSIFGTLIGALIIAVIENGMNLVQIESYTQKVVFGVVILLAVLLDQRSRTRGA
jgi:ribose transport system permease protein